jgi:hypothetical protein
LSAGIRTTPISGTSLRGAEHLDRVVAFAPESGSVRFLGGSHRLGALPVRYDLRKENMLSSGQVADLDISALHARAGLAEPAKPPSTMRLSCMARPRT